MKKPKKNPQKPGEFTPLFEAYALADKKRVSPESKTSIPSELNVKEAKDWVDDNKK